MSTVASIASTPADQASGFLNPATPAITHVGQKTLGIDDFLKLITTQLTQQDPLKPMEDTQFISQMASFTSLQQMQTLSKDFETFTADQKALSAQDYLGKTVTIATAAGNITGPVTAVSFDSGAPLLSVAGGKFSPSAVIGISTGATPAVSATSSSNPSSTVSPTQSSGTTN